MVAHQAVTPLLWLWPPSATCITSRYSSHRKILRSMVFSLKSLGSSTVELQLSFSSSCCSYSCFFSCSYSYLCMKPSTLPQLVMRSHLSMRTR